MIDCSNYFEINEINEIIHVFRNRRSLSKYNRDYQEFFNAH